MKPIIYVKKYVIILIKVRLVLSFWHHTVIIDMMQKYLYGWIQDIP